MFMSVSLSVPLSLPVAMTTYVRAQSQRSFSCSCPFMWPIPCPSLCPCPYTCSGRCPSPCTCSWHCQCRWGCWHQCQCQCQCQYQSRCCVGDTHIGAASSDEADLHIKSSTGPPTSRDPHPSSLPLEAYSNMTSSILRTV